MLSDHDLAKLLETACARTPQMPAQKFWRYLSPEDIEDIRQGLYTLESLTVFAENWSTPIEMHDMPFPVQAAEKMKKMDSKPKAYGLEEKIARFAGNESRTWVIKRMQLIGERFEKGYDNTVFDMYLALLHGENLKTANGFLLNLSDCMHSTVDGNTKVVQNWPTRHLPNGYFEVSIHQSPTEAQTTHLANRLMEHFAVFFAERDNSNASIDFEIFPGEGTMKVWAIDGPGGTKDTVEAALREFASLACAKPFMAADQNWSWMKQTYPVTSVEEEIQVFAST